MLAVLSRFGNMCMYIYIYTYELQIWVLEAHNLTTCDLSNNLQYDLNQQTWQVDHEHFGGNTSTKHEDLNWSELKAR